MTIKLEINERIGGTHARLIDENGVQKGVVSMREALWHANNAGLDLVKIADANPPVCKVLDAGKYLYDLQKQQKAVAKKQRENATVVKEVQLSPNIGDHDLNIKAGKAKAFLEDGDKVKIDMRFRGRQNAHKDLGREVITKFLAAVGEHKVERALTESGNTLSMVIQPEAKKK